METGIAVLRFECNAEKPSSWNSRISALESIVYQLPMRWQLDTWLHISRATVPKCFWPRFLWPQGSRTSACLGHGCPQPHASFSKALRAWREVFDPGRPLEIPGDIRPENFLWAAGFWKTLLGAHKQGLTRQIFRENWTTIGHGEVRVHRGTDVSRGVRRTTWDRSLYKIGSSKSLALKSFSGREHFGTRPCQSPSHFGIRLHFLCPHFPSPNTILPGNRAFSGGAWSIFIAYGFAGPTWAHSSTPHSHGGRAEIAPKGALLNKESVLKVKKFRVFSGCLQGIFRVLFPMPFLGMPFVTMAMPPHSRSEKEVVKLCLKSPVSKQTGEILSRQLTKA